MPEDPLIGNLLGQYRIESIIGKGGMATVYRGIQVAVNRVVAVKVLPGSFMHDDTFMSRFRQEAEVAAQLEHIRILPVYDYGEDNGTPYIVMRYIDGGTLRQLTKTGPLGPEDTVRIVDQVAEALDYAHARYIVHRDLKPSNIMLDSDKNTYLADFGTAKLRDRSAQLTGSGVVGTPAYMAPEQSMPGQVTSLVDIYALGVTLFEMITGQVPYSADTPIVQILMHIQHPVPSLLEYNRSVSPEVDAVVKRAMAKRPEDRFSKATDLAKALSVAVTASGGWHTDTRALSPVLAVGHSPASPALVEEEEVSEAPPISDRSARSALAALDPRGTEAVPESEALVDINELDAAYRAEVEEDSASAVTREVIHYPGRRSGMASIPALITNEGHRFEITSSNTLIGRADPKKGIFVDIDLTEIDTRKRTSRTHARILERDDQYIIWDLHSLNGTFVNGRRIQEGGRQAIGDGDVLQFGKDGGVTLIFEW
nr:protein kinase [Anaerolineae bacterium]